MLLLFSIAFTSKVSVGLLMPSPPCSAVLASFMTSQAGLGVVYDARALTYPTIEYFYRWPYAHRPLILWSKSNNFDKSSLT